jgi:dephospho-CoA kinase
MAFKYAIALTGGIGTGKSTSSSLFRLGGFRIIDADMVAHNILKSSTEKIVELFGSEYIDDGCVDKKKLGKLIFKDKDAKRKLESFIHPLIFKKIEEESERYDRFQFPYLIDIPLFFERNVYPIEKVIVVYAPRDMQIERVMERDRFDRDEAIRRVDSQLDIEEKRDKATYLIDNSGSLKNLQLEVERIVREISNS